MRGSIPQDSEFSFQNPSTMLFAVFTVAWSRAAEGARHDGVEGMPDQTLKTLAYLPFCCICQDRAFKDLACVSSARPVPSASKLSQRGSSLHSLPVEQNFLPLGEFQQRSLPHRWPAQSFRLLILGDSCSSYHPRLPAPRWELLGCWGQHNRRHWTATPLHRPC